MNKHFFAAAFLLGALAVVWVGAGYAASHPLALAMTLTRSASRPGRSRPETSTIETLALLASSKATVGAMAKAAVRDAMDDR